MCMPVTEMGGSFIAGAMSSAQTVDIRNTCAEKSLILFVLSK